MNRYAAELLGTFMLVFAGCGAVVVDEVTHGGVTHVGVAVTFGLVVMAMIYAVGGVSGAHLNPAVTIGFWTARRFPTKSVLPYVISQFGGALIAAALLKLTFAENRTLGATLPVGPAMRSFVLETVLTMILMFVILCVSSGSKETGVMAGIAVGGVILFEAMFAGPISGASMNPARSLAPALISGHLESIWVYLAAPVIGAAIAVPCWTIVNSKRSVPGGAA